MNRSLTRFDLDERERLLNESGVAGAGDVQKAKAESEGLGLFRALWSGATAKRRSKRSRAS
jgi:hypothetical protein